MQLRSATWCSARNKLRRSLVFATSDSRGSKGVRVTSEKELLTLPEDLPVPEDDGAADHLTGSEVPSLVLDSSQGPVDLGQLGASRAVIYVYPRTGKPGEELPPGWDAFPGARGCTPQSCAFRDHAAELAGFGARVAGVSVQPLADQIEFATRNHMPYPVMADPNLLLHEALSLPTFELGGKTFYRRLTCIVERRRIVKVFYPVFPPGRNVLDVLAWLGQHPPATG